MEPKLQTLEEFFNDPENPCPWPTHEKEAVIRELNGMPEETRTIKDSPNPITRLNWEGHKWQYKGIFAPICYKQWDKAHALIQQHDPELFDEAAKIAYCKMFDKIEAQRSKPINKIIELATLRVQVELLQKEVEFWKDVAQTWKQHSQER